jgi:phosphatidate phosphatase APP1
MRARPYQGHGTVSLVHVKGRVLEQTGVTSPLPSRSPVQNLVAMVRRFTATPVPGAQVMVRVGGAEVRVSSDADGYVLEAVEEAELTEQVVRS